MPTPSERDRFYDDMTKRVGRLYREMEAALALLGRDEATDERAHQQIRNVSQKMRRLSLSRPPE